MIKILFMLNDLHGGGQEKAIVSLLSELSKKKEYELILLLMRKQGVFLEDVPPSVQIKEVPVSESIIDSSLLSSKARLKKAISHGKIKDMILILQEYLRHRNKSISDIMLEAWQRYDKLIPMYPEEYDIAIDYQGQGTFPTYYIARKVKAKKKYSWVHNDFSIVLDDMSWMGDCYAAYDKILSVSEKAKLAFADKFPDFRDKTAVCYNVMNKQEILKRSNETTISPKDGINIVTVGRLSYEKGYDIAFQAMKLLKETQKKITYWVVGNDKEEDSLKTLAERLGIMDMVCFAGFQKNPYPYLRMADIYLQPSRHEGFCLTLGEAKVLNKAIVTTDFAGASEQITHGVNGSITTCDAEAIYNELKHLIEHPEVADKYRFSLQSQQGVDRGFVQFTTLVKE